MARLRARLQTGDVLRLSRGWTVGPRCRPSVQREEGTDQAVRAWDCETYVRAESRRGAGHDRAGARWRALPCAAEEHRRPRRLLALRGSQLHRHAVYGDGVRHDAHAEVGCLVPARRHRQLDALRDDALQEARPELRADLVAARQQVQAGAELVQIRGQLKAPSEVLVAEVLVAQVRVDPGNDRLGLRAEPAQDRRGRAVIVLEQREQLAPAARERNADAVLRTRDRCRLGTAANRPAGNRVSVWAGRVFDAALDRSERTLERAARLVDDDLLEHGALDAGEPFLLGPL